MADPRAKTAQKTLTDDPARNGVPYPGGMGEMNADEHDNVTPLSAPPIYGLERKAGGGCVTARGAATTAKLRARHGKDV